MVDVEAALKRLTAANRRLADREAERQTAMVERDEALQAAKTAGATYEAIKAATGLSTATVTKALGRR